MRSCGYLLKHPNEYLGQFKRLLARTMSIGPRGTSLLHCEFFFGSSLRGSCQNAALVFAPRHLFSSVQTPLPLDGLDFAARGWSRKKNVHTNLCGGRRRCQYFPTEQPRGPRRPTRSFAKRALKNCCLLSLVLPVMCVLTVNIFLPFNSFLLPPNFSCVNAT